MTEEGRYREWMPGEFKAEVGDILGGAVTLRVGDGTGGPSLKEQEEGN